MNVIGIVIIALLAVAAVLGLIIGLCKGFSNIKSWGVEYLLASVLTVLIGGAISKEFTATNGIITICLAIGFLLAFGGSSATLRKIFKKSKRKKIARGGKKRGPSGFVDSIFGGFTLAVKGLVIVGVVSAFILVALDLAQIGAVTQFLGDIYAHGAWTGLKPYIMDFLYIGAITLAIKCGFSSGISNTLWGVIVLGLVIFVGFVAYHLAFEVESFAGAVSGLAGVFAGEGDVSATHELIAKIALTAGLFLLMLVVVILIAVFVPKLLNFARGGKTFYIIDGIFGAVFATAFVVGIFLVLGSIFQPLAVDLEAYPFMAQFTSYFEKSALATYFYNNDLLILFGMDPILPLAEWLS